MLTCYCSKCIERQQIAIFRERVAVHDGILSFLGSGGKAEVNDLRTRRMEARNEMVLQFSSAMACYHIRISRKEDRRKRSKRQQQRMMGGRAEGCANED